MVGRKESVSVLNNTLRKVIQLLNENNMKCWFVCYGTLLGLVRENNCIDGDDDIDIVVHKDYYFDLKRILIQNDFELTYGYGISDSKHILKTIPVSGKYASIDVYMAEFKNECVYDLWNNLNITNCFLNVKEQTFLEKIWNEEKLYFPSNYLKILEKVVV